MSTQTFEFKSGYRKDGGWLCPWRWPRHLGGLGFLNCDCARFEDGSCVPPHLYPEFVSNRDVADKNFNKREIYNFFDKKEIKYNG